jgi:hypothetical protein
VQRPAELTDALLGWANVGMTVRQVLDKQQPGFSTWLDLDAPVELAIALPELRKGAPHGVISVGVRSVDLLAQHFRSKGRDVREIAPGVHQVDLAPESFCVVARSLGRSRARLVCGENSVAVKALLAYATRGLPAETLSKSDLFLELRADPARKRFGAEMRQARMLAPIVIRQLALDNQRFDRALGDAVHGLLDEALALAEDIDRIVVESSLRSAEQQVDLGLKMRFSGKSAWTVQALLDTEQRATTTPGLFFRLPGDAVTASFEHAPSNDRLEGPRRTLVELLDGFLEHAGLATRQRQQLSTLAHRALSRTAPSVSAAGSLPRSPAASANVTDALRQRIGWMLFGTEEASDRYRSMLRAVGELVEDRSVRQEAQRRGKLEAELLPRARVRNAVGYGPDSAELELTVPAALQNKLIAAEREQLEPATQPLVVYALAVSAKGESWIAVAADKDQAYTLLRRALTGEGGATLAGRAGLTQLKDARAISGGFVTLAGLLQQGSTSGEDAERLRKALVAAPHRGEVPIVFLGRVERADATQLSVELTVPKAAVEDFAAAMVVY